VVGHGIVQLSFNFVKRAKAWRAMSTLFPFYSAVANPQAERSFVQGNSTCSLSFGQLENPVLSAQARAGVTQCRFSATRPDPIGLGQFGWNSLKNLGERLLDCLTSD